METLVANITGKVRRETLDGRRYLVAPVVLMQGGSVMNGSKGALYYPPEECAREPGMWNNVPLTDGHPVENGYPVSARSPEVLAKYKLGYIFNDRWDGSKRTAEAWYDEELTRNKSPKTYEALEQNRPFDLSTGLMTDNVLAANGSQAKGKAYSHIARNYRPDHVASLVGQTGACSLRDGCGVLVGNVCEECSGDPTDNAFCPTGEGGGQDNSCSAYTTKEVQDKEGYTVGHDVVDPSGKTVDFYDHESEAKEKASSLTAEATAKWISSPEGKKAIKNRDKKIKEIQDTVRDARRMGNLAEVKDLEKEITKLKSMNLRKFTSNEDQSVTNEDKRSLWRQLGDMLGITTTENAFCPTGKGGGQDNSCSSQGGTNVIKPGTPEYDAYLARQSAGMQKDLDKLNRGPKEKKLNAKQLKAKEDKEIRGKLEKMDQASVLALASKHGIDPSRYDYPGAHLYNLHSEMLREPAIRDSLLTQNEEGAVTNEEKRSLWRQLGDMLGITTTENAFCPTGKGGGQDNSCSSTEGGSDSSEVKGKPIPDSPYGIPQGQTVKFHDGEFKGYEVQLQGLIRKNLSRKEDDVHRGQIVGIKGGAGEITVSHSTLKKYATLTANQSTEGDAMPTPTNKEELVSYLTTNCSCHKGKEKALNALDEETLEVFKTQHEELAANQLVVNAVRESDPTLKDIAVNELPAAFKKKSPTAAKETCPDCGYPVGPDHVCPPKKTTMNKLAPASERLTPEEIETLEIAREVTQNSKSQLLDLVVNANASNDAAKKAIRPLYEKLSYKELKTLADNLPKGRPTTNDDHGDLLLNFFTGASGGGHHTTNRGSEPDPNDVLEPFYTPAKS